MAQGLRLVNLDKKEFVASDDLGLGEKFWEQQSTYPTTGDILFLLVYGPYDDGIGSDKNISDALGRWAGDRVTVVGLESCDMDWEDYQPISDQVGRLLEVYGYRVVSRGSYNVREKIEDNEE